MANPVAALTSFRTDIDSALDLISALMMNARSDEERVELLNINRALTMIATDIDNRELASRNRAIEALTQQLGSSASSLNAIHQKAVDLKGELDIAQKLLDAFGNVTKAVTASGSNKPVGAGTKPSVGGASTPTPRASELAGRGGGDTASDIGTVVAGKIGGWSQISQPAPFDVSMILLLTDGSVLCQANNLNEWWRLFPSTSGWYATGRWERSGNSINAPLYYASAVLSDGKVIVAGGEYNWGNQADLCAAELFDPVSNSWSALGTPQGWTKVGDAPCCVLPDGRMIVGSIEGKPCAIYDPVSAQWSSTGAKNNRTCDEETWTLLADGSVLTADCIEQPQTERYVNGSWRIEGNTPIQLVEAASSEIGPAILLPSGQIWAIGATGNTAVFTPDPNQTRLGTWRGGPTFPKDSNDQQLGAKDAPACLLPNGRVLCAVGPVDGAKDNYLAPTTFFEFDAARPSGSLKKLAMQPGNGGEAPYVGRLLLLPSGEVMFVNGTADVWFYRPTGTPNPNWAPTITQVSSMLAQGGSYELKGTQLNGLSQACSYGDDASLATNYPLVRLRSASTDAVVYCRTFGHSTMAVATGGKPVSTRFEIPTSVAPGNYRLAVVANGIASKEVVVTVALAGVPAGVVPGAVGAQLPSRAPQPVVARRGNNAGALGTLAAVLLVGTFAANIIWAPSQLLHTWLVTLVLTAVSLALLGVSGGRWEATFIDNRNRMSLSKLQVILWTVVIFSALLSASCFNAGNLGDVSKIMGIAVDPKLWGLLGLSITAAVGAPIALSAKETRNVVQGELDDTRRNLRAMTGVPEANVQNEGHVLIKASQADARWSDLIRGDDVGNADTIDFSKIQHLYFTLLTLLIFGLSVAREFLSASELAQKLGAHETVIGANKQPISQAIIDQLPVPDAGFLGLLAASGAGYLIYKGMSHTKDAP